MLFGQILIKNIITEKFDELLRSRLIGYLNSREWAILTWLFIILLVMIFHSSLRSDLMDVLKAIGRLAIQPVFIVILIYQLISQSIHETCEIQNSFEFWPILECERFF